MASNEDILMEFTAQDNITSVVEGMEASVTSALESISSAMDSLDAGFDNLSSTAEAMSNAFDTLDLSMGSAEGSADSFNQTNSNIDSGNISDVQSDFDSLSGTISEASSEVDNLATEISSLDGTSVSVDIDASTISGDSASEWDADAELGGEATEQDTSALRTSMYDDMVNASNTLRDLGNSAVESASAAEQGWLKFGNAVNNTGGNWEAQSDSIKAWIKDYSNSMGRGVADTRTAMTTFMNMGMSLKDTQNTMKVVSNYAAQFGMTQAEAGQSIQMAFMGAGRSVKKLGLDIADFKDEAGNVDKEKLLQAMMEKTSGAAEKYADTYEARVQRMNNAINSLRTDFGKEIINTIEPLIPVVQQLLQSFSGLPQPIKSAILGFAGLAGGAAMVAGPLVKMKAYLNMSGTELGSVKKSLDILKAGYKSLAGGEGISAAINAMKNFNKVSESSAISYTMGNTTLPNGFNTSSVSKSTQEVVKDASATAALSSEAEAAAAGTTATGSALSGISAAFTSLIVPLVAIAAVVAVMIPIIAGLAAEALIFIKGIQVLIDALDFDSINLDGAITGIRQVGQALLEMGVAMGEMTFANIMTGLGVLTSGITGLVNPIQVAGQMLVKTADELKVFNNVSIDKNVPSNLKSISTSLQAVSTAMSSLTNVVLNMALGNLVTLGGLFGNVSTAIRTAKTEITEAAREIDTLKDLPDLDKGAVSKLEKVSSSLESVSKAMEALRSLRDAHNWDSLFSGLTNLFGGVDIQSALYSIKDDVYKAASSLSIFKDMATVPDGVSSKLKKVADTLSSVSESVESLRKLRDDYNWDSSWGQIFQGTDIVGALNSLRSDLFRVSASLRTLNDMSAIPEGTGEKIQRVAWTTNNVITAYNSLKNLNDKVDGGADLSNVISSVDSANRVIRQVATRLLSMGTIANVPEGLGGKITSISNTVKKITSAVNSFNSVPTVGGTATSNITQGVTTIRNVINQLNRLNDSGVTGGIGQILSSVTSAVNQLKSTLNSTAGGFKSSGSSIGSNLKSGVNTGLNGLNGIVVSHVNRAASSGASASWTGGARMGNSGKRGFQSAFKISNIVTSEINYSIQAVKNGEGSFITAVGEMARKAVEEAKTELDQHSPGKIARMWGAEMGYSADMVNSQGTSLLSSISNITNRAVSMGTGFSLDSALNTGSTNPNLLNTINSMNTPMNNNNQGNNNPVNIIINSGAIQLDAHNLTTQESRQILINALEGLDAITNIDVNGG